MNYKNISKLRNVIQRKKQDFYINLKKPLSFALKYAN